MAGQRIIIPKGSIRAEETNVIEIPVHLQNSSVVVAQPKDAPPEQPGMEGGCAPTCVNYNVARSRQPIQAGFDARLLDLPASPPPLPPRPRRPSQQGAPRSPSPPSPAGGRRLSQPGPSSSPRPQTAQGSPGPQSPARRFDQSESMQSWMSWGDDSRNQNNPPSTPYAKFAVEAAERGREMAASTPKDRSLQNTGEDWVNSVCDYEDGRNFYKPHPRAYRYPQPIELNWPDGTQNRKQFEGVNVPADAPWPKTPAPPSTATTEKMKLLDQMEFVEQDQLMDDLRNYQKTRRRLVYDVVNMSSLIETPID